MRAIEAERMSPTPELVDAATVLNRRVTRTGPGELIGFAPAPAERRGDTARSRTGAADASSCGARYHGDRWRTGAGDGSPARGQATERARLAAGGRESRSSRPGDRRWRLAGSRRVGGEDRPWSSGTGPGHADSLIPVGELGRWRTGRASGDRPRRADRVRPRLRPNVLVTWPVRGRAPRLARALAASRARGQALASGWQPTHRWRGQPMELGDRPRFPTA